MRSSRDATRVSSDLASSRAAGRDILAGVSVIFRERQNGERLGSRRRFCLSAKLEVASHPAVGMGELNRQGFLTKEGGSWKSWKKRFFVLRGGDLMYSKKPEGGSLGIISLKGAGKIEPVEYKKKEFCFSLQTPERVWYMCCSSEEDRKNWVDALTKERNRVNAPPKAIPVGGTAPAPKPIGLEDFDLMKVIGKGSFGKVFQVRKKDNGQIYAMKVLNKKAIIKRGEVQHTLTEKNILKNLVHPFLVNLYFTFQTQDKLCFVMGSLPR